MSGGGGASPLPFFSAYATSKAGIVRFTENISEELRDYKIDINAIAPGPVNTKMLDEVLKEKPRGLKTVGFAAETDLSFKILNEKWDRKPVDLLVGTQVHNGLTPGCSQVSGFSNESAHYSFMENKKITFEGPLNKKFLAQKILQRFFRD